MSKASDNFSIAIQDAENLLRHFDSLNTKPPPPEIEVLKRAGLVMAMTAWETYVEDRLQEACGERMQSVRDNSIATFIKSKLDEEIKRLNNPAYVKTVQLFGDYAGVDLKKSWRLPNQEPQSVRDRLDALMKLRGDVVHRSLLAGAQTTNGHPVTKEDLKKAINFLKNLVSATEKAFDKPVPGS
jgi:hypothetical protein